MKNPFSEVELLKQIELVKFNQRETELYAQLMGALKERQRLRKEVDKVIDESFGKFGGYDCNKVKEDLKQKLGLSQEKK